MTSIGSILETNGHVNRVRDGGLAAIKHTFWSLWIQYPWHMHAYTYTHIYLYIYIFKMATFGECSHSPISMELTFSERLVLISVEVPSFTLGPVIKRSHIIISVNYATRAKRSTTKPYANLYTITRSTNHHWPTGQGVISHAVTRVW